MQEGEADWSTVSPRRGQPLCRLLFCAGSREGRLITGSAPGPQSAGPPPDSCALALPFQSKNNRPLRTGQMYAQDENATHTQLYTSHFDLMKMTAGKRSPPIKPL